MARQLNLRLHEHPQSPDLLGNLQNFLMLPSADVGTFQFNIIPIRKGDVLQQNCRRLLTWLPLHVS